MTTTVPFLRPKAITPGYPIATIHAVGWVLQRLRRSPRVANICESFGARKHRAGECAPPDRDIRKMRLWIEADMLASRVILVRHGCTSIVVNLSKVYSHPSDCRSILALRGEHGDTARLLR